MVLMLVKSMFCFTGEMGGAVAVLMQSPFMPAVAGRSMEKIVGDRFSSAGHPLHPAKLF
jgi:hypothetical protein